MKLSLIRIVENEAELGEAAGVPENIVETAERIYDILLNVVENNDFKSIQDRKGFLFKEDFRIADMNFNVARFHFVFQKKEQEQPVEFKLMNVKFEGKFDDNKMVYNRYKDLDLGITHILTFNETATYDDFKEYFSNERKEIIEFIAHELKHYYDFFKMGKYKLKDKANYDANDVANFDLLAVDNFLYLLYYCTAMENLVRPTELYAAIRQNGVKQKDFYNFLLNHETYKMVKVLKDFSYEQFKQDVKDNHMDRVDELLAKHGKGDVTDPDEKVNLIMKLLYITITNEKLAIFNSKLNPLRKLKFIYKTQNEAFEDFKKIETRFKSHDDFFLHNEKEFKLVADRMLKKISKLYSLLDPDKEVERQKAINEFRVDEQLLQRIKDKAVEIGNKAGEVSRNIAGKVGDRLKNYSKQGDTTPPKPETGRKYEETKANFIKLASDPTKILGFGEAVGQNDGSVITMAQMNAETAILKKLGKNEATFGTFIVDDAMFQLPNGNKQYLVVLEMTPPGKL